MLNINSSNNGSTTYTNSYSHTSFKLQFSNDDLSFIIKFVETPTQIPPPTF